MIVSLLKRHKVKKEGVSPLFYFNRTHVRTGPKFSWWFRISSAADFYGCISVSYLFCTSEMALDVKAQPIRRRSWKRAEGIELNGKDKSITPDEEAVSMMPKLHEAAQIYKNNSLKNADNAEISAQNDAKIKYFTI